MSQFAMNVSSDFLPAVESQAPLPGQSGSTINCETSIPGKCFTLYFTFIGKLRYLYICRRHSANCDVSLYCGDNLLKKGVDVSRTGYHLQG